MIKFIKIKYYGEDKEYSNITWIPLNKIDAIIETSCGCQIHMEDGDTYYNIHLSAEDFLKEIQGNNEDMMEKNLSKETCDTASCDETFYGEPITEHFLGQKIIVVPKKYKVNSKNNIIYEYN